MDRPTRELLRPDVAALDAPSTPKPGLPSAAEGGAYAPPAYATPIQGRVHPPLDPDAGLNEVGRQMSGDPGTTYVVANGPTVWALPNED